MKNVVKLLSILLLASGVVFTSCSREVTGLKLDKDKVELEVGDNLTLVATVEPSDAKDKTVKWTTSDPAIVAVEDGKLTAIAVGTARITATTVSGGYEKICDVTVGPKIADSYEVRVATATLRSSDNQAVNLEVTSEETPPFNMGGVSGYDLVGLAQNISGKMIPAGTPYKYRVLVNGTVFETKEYKLLTDIPAANGVLLVCRYVSFAGIPVAAFGEQTFRVELLQIGKKELATPVSGEHTYKVSPK